MIELPGDLERPALFGLEKEVDSQLGVSHPSGGVDPRADPEPDVAFRHPLPAQAADVDKAFQIRAVLSAELAEPLLDEDPVLAPQSGDIRDRPDGDELQIMAEIFLRLIREAFSREEGLDQLEGDPDSGQAPVGISRGFENGVENGQGLGELGAGEVMVGDDDVDPELPGPPDKAVGLDAAVHADDETGASFRGDGDVLVLDAVAVLEPLGDEMIDRSRRASRGPSGA